MGVPKKWEGRPWPRWSNGGGGDAKKVGGGEAMASVEPRGVGGCQKSGRKGGQAMASVEPSGNVKAGV